MVRLEFLNSFGILTLAALAFPIKHLTLTVLVQSAVHKKLLLDLLLILLLGNISGSSGVMFMLITIQRILLGIILDAHIINSGFLTIRIRIKIGGIVRR